MAACCLRVIGGSGQDVLDDTQGGGTRFSSADADDRVDRGPGDALGPRRVRGAAQERERGVDPCRATGDAGPSRCSGSRTTPTSGSCSTQRY